METWEVYAETLYTGKGLVKGALVTIEGDTIVSVERSSPKGEKAFAVTPALVDAHSHIGLERHGESYEESDVNDKGDSLWPFADALDGIQMEDKAFQLSLAGGVAYSSVLPGSGNIIGGRGVVIRNWAENTEEAFIAWAGYKAALGYNPKTTEEWKGHRPTTRQGILRELRVRLLKAEQLLRALEKGKKEWEELELEEQFFIHLLQGKERLRVHLHRQDDLYALLRLVDRFSLNVTVEHACAVGSVKAFNALARRGIPLVYGPLDSFAYKDELRGEWPTNIRALLSSKAFFGLMSDHPVIMQHTLLYTARWVLWAGATEEEAIAAVSYRNAEILGLKDIGRVEEGAKASLLLWDRSPFDMRARPRVIVEGQEWERPF